MRFGLIAHPKKPLIIARSGVSRETRCLKVVRSLLQLAYFVYVRSESPGEVMRTYLHGGTLQALKFLPLIAFIYQNKCFRGTMPVLTLFPLIEFIYKYQNKCFRGT